MKKLLKKAQKGDVRAQVALAARLATGEGCEQDLLDSKLKCNTL